MDRNKTELTQNLTHTVALWLAERGFKPVETEVAVSQGWVADVAGVCRPTQTELIELKLLKRAPNSPRGLSIPEEVWDRYHEAIKAWNAQREALPGLLTATVEVKTSVPDFRRDRKWTAIPPTSLCYVAMPEGMIPAERWPEGWGIILSSQDGARIRKVHPPKLHIVSAEQQLEVVANLGEVRDNRTRFERLREWQRTVRITDAERKTVARVSEVFRAIQDIMEGVPIERALLRQNIRAKLPQAVLTNLRKLKPQSEPHPQTHSAHEAPINLPLH